MTARSRPGSDTQRRPCIVPPAIVPSPGCSPAQKVGEELNVGAGTVLDIKDARVKGYAVEDGVETWRLADFEAVRRTKISHKVS